MSSKSHFTVNVMFYYGQENEVDASQQNNWFLVAGAALIFAKPMPFLARKRADCFPILRQWKRGMNFCLSWP